MKGFKILFGAVVISGLIACSPKPESVAKVGDRQVTKAEIESYLSLKKINSKNKEQYQSAKQYYLNNLALIAAIEKEGSLDQQKIETELFEIKKDLILNRYLMKFLDDAVTDTAMRNYYAENQSKYQKEKAKVSHILFRLDKNANEQQRQAKYSKAMEAYSKLKTGIVFNEITAQYSDDLVSAKKGGQLGWMQKGAISPVFSEKVFSQLHASEISEPFLTEFGYHIVKLEQSPSIVKQPFEKVRGNIKRILRQVAKESELKRLQTSITVTQ